MLPNLVQCTVIGPVAGLPVVEFSQSVAQFSHAVVPINLNPFFISSTTETLNTGFLFPKGATSLSRIDNV